MLKEKFKMLKSDLKLWNKEVFTVMKTNIDAKKEKIRELDRQDNVLVSKSRIFLFLYFQKNK